LLISLPFWTMSFLPLFLCRYQSFRLLFWLHLSSSNVVWTNSASFAVFGWSFTCKNLL
jgi:hypothetical protein